MCARSSVTIASLLLAACSSGSKSRVTADARSDGSRSWHNGDDGWDLCETDFAVQIINCWTC